MIRQVVNCSTAEMIDDTVRTSWFLDRLFLPMFRIVHLAGLRWFTRFASP
jgi:hypothetical protein